MLHICINITLFFNHYLKISTQYNSLKFIILYNYCNADIYILFNCVGNYLYFYNN